MYLILTALFILFSVANVSIITLPNATLLNDALALALLLFLPGTLLLITLGNKIETFWEKFSVMTGLSVALVTLLGLVLNYLLPYFGLVPLARYPYLASFDVFLLTLFVINYFKYRKQKDRFSWWDRIIRKSSFKPRLSKEKKAKRRLNRLFFLSAMTFPFLASFGTLRLDNGYGGFFAILFLAAVGIYLLFLAKYQNKLSENIYPTTIFFTGISLLLMTSLRGLYLTGHDVQFEYYIFQLTKTHHFWDINFYKDAYNACLSITILPTILSSFLSFRDVYIYKVIFQVIFALCPVTIYFIVRKYTKPFFAFLSAFYFLTFPTFLNDMPMLNRQEIGFLFFSLLLYILFYKDEIKGKPTILFLLSFGLVTAHYSTNYIATALIGATFAAFTILKMNWVKSLFFKLKLDRLFKGVPEMPGKSYISIWLVITLAVLTVTWNTLITKTSNNLVKTMTTAITNISSIFKQENKSIDIAYSLFSSYKINDAKFIQKDIEKSIDAAQKQSDRNFFDQVVTDIKPEIIKKTRVPITSVGKFLSSLGVNVFNFNSFSRQTLAKLIQVLVILGTATIIFFKPKYKVDAEFVLASGIGIFLIGLMVILPGVSVDYGLLRLFQQMLIMLSLPIVYGTTLLFSQLKKINPVYPAVIVLVIFFWNLSGFVSEVTGDYYPQLNLNNSGAYYDGYYVHSSDVASIRWLSSIMVGPVTVQANRIDRDKLWAYGNIPTIDGTFPQIIRKSSYVYMGFANTKGVNVISPDRLLEVKYPENFLEANKNLVYNNGLSKIYK